ncbi:MAG: reactive intermediate/imine deaminase [Chloroflexi bacterium]|nr:reactive intermediate/imine deaminase [Chloroflexota bacterium]
MPTPEKHAVRTDRAAPPAGPYNQAVRWGNLVFTASVGGRRPGQEPAPDADIRAHTANALENLKAILEAAGSSLDNVLKITAYLRDMNDFDAMNEVYRRYITGVLPARALVSVPGYRSPVAFDAIAFVAAE